MSDTREITIPLDAMPQAIHTAFANCLNAAVAAQGLKCAMHTLNTGARATLSFEIIGGSIAIATELDGKVLQ